MLPVCRAGPYLKKPGRNADDLFILLVYYACKGLKHTRNIFNNKIDTWITLQKNTCPVHR